MALSRRAFTCIQSDSERHHFKYMSSPVAEAYRGSYGLLCVRMFVYVHTIYVYVYVFLYMRVCVCVFRFVCSCEYVRDVYQCVCVYAFGCVCASLLIKDAAIACMNVLHAVCFACMHLCVRVYACALLCQHARACFNIACRMFAHIKCLCT